MPGNDQLAKIGCHDWDCEDFDPILLLLSVLKKIQKRSDFTEQHKEIFAKLSVLINDVYDWVDYECPNEIKFDRRPESTNFEYVCELTTSILDQCQIGQDSRIELVMIMASG